MDGKVHQWLTAGTRLVWVINPRQRTVTVYRSGSSATVLKESDTLDGADVVPGFTCPLRQIFI